LALLVPAAAPAAASDVLVAPPGASPRDQAVARACRRGLGETRGAVVAMDPRDGRVLALVNPVYGLFHAYQPCSVFKLVVGLSALRAGVATPETVYECDGGCWTWPGHGAIDLRRALAVSCNPYFEWLGERLGWDELRNGAHELGLGAITGVNLTGEVAGALPARVDQGRVGHVSSHAAGIRATALQLAALVSASVNGGNLFAPRLARPEGFEPQLRRQLGASLPFGALLSGYYSAVTEGSAHGAFQPEIAVGAKTGSCSGVGWIASFAPLERPEIVLVVFLRRGNGRQASAVAGRIYADLIAEGVLRAPAPR